MPGWNFLTTVPFPITKRGTGAIAPTTIIRDLKPPKAQAGADGNMPGGSLKMAR